MPSAELSLRSLPSGLLAVPDEQGGKIIRWSAAAAVADVAVVATGAWRKAALRAACSGAAGRPQGLRQPDYGPW